MLDCLKHLLCYPGIVNGHWVISHICLGLHGMSNNLGVQDVVDHASHGHLRRRHGNVLTNLRG